MVSYGTVRTFRTRILIARAQLYLQRLRMASIAQKLMTMPRRRQMFSSCIKILVRHVFAASPRAYVFQLVPTSQFKTNDLFGLR